ncbi:mucin-2-like [Limulus polyphemus]|uniref:Mucin-2-like n=1 Tax=Limulus polyphemus TaxID=6850 RepID=A0ABM1BMB4_LIMPO|nr:mucin-2-like [Limulus polyphemus]
MSLETLLEAAKYLEYKTQAKARGEEPRDYQTFANFSTVGASAHPSCPPANQTIKILPESPEDCSSSPTSQDQVDEQKEKRRTGGAGTREVHNKLEKNRRAHLKECFENLKKQLPNIDERKISNLSILRGALRYIQTLKKKEREYEHEMEQLAREKIASQQRLAALKKDLSAHLDHVDINNLLPDPDNETTTTASEAGESDIEEDSKVEETETSSFYNFIQSSETSNTSSTLLSTPSSTPPQSMGITSPLCVEKKQALPFNPPEDSGAKTTVTFLQTTTSAASLVSPVSMTPGFTPNVFIGVPKKKDTKSVLATMATRKNTTVASTRQKCLRSQEHGPSDSVLKLNSVNATGVLASESVQIVNQSTVSKISQVPPLTSTNIITNGPLKNFTKTVPSMIEGPVATGFSVPKLVTLPNSSLKPVLSHSLVCVTPGPLAQPQSVISLTPVSSTSKSVIINNQAATISNEVTMATPSLVNHVTGKSVAIPAPDTTGANSVITTRGIVWTSGTTVIPQPNLQFMKPMPQILHHTVAPRTHIVPLGGSQVNSMKHHLVTAAIKPVHQTGQPKARFSHLSSVGHVTHVMPSSSVTAPVSHLVSGATAVSAIAPLVTPISVVSPGGPMNQAQLITQPHHLGKVLATTPLLKTSDQIPIIQSQFLQPTVGLVKPVVMVSVPSVGNGSQVAVTAQQQGVSSVSISQ